MENGNDMDNEQEADLPAFLLPFIEEHVCAVESQEAKREAKAQEDSTWTHVQGKRGSQIRAYQFTKSCNASSTWLSALHDAVLKGAARGCTSP